MAGVTITTAVRTGAINTGTAPAAKFFLLGTAERGKSDLAYSVTSLEDFETKFGSHVSGSYSWYSMKTFFEEGGVQSYFKKVDASDGVAATKAFLTATGDAAGVTFTAVSKGTWGNTATFVVTNNSTNFDVTIAYSGTTIYSGAGFTSLTELITSANADTTLANYYTCALTAGATASQLLATAASTSASNGSDGTVAKSDFISAIDAFTENLGAGAVAAPGVATGSSDGALYDALRTHAASNNRIALAGFASTNTLAQARSASTGYTGTTSHEYMAFYHPWVQIPNGSVTVDVPPEAYVAAVRARTHNAVGAWKAYAGVASEAKFVSGTTLAVSRADGDLMDASYVNPIRVINGRVRIYGARSHSSVVAQWRFITARDTINYINVEANERLEDLVFSTIDGRQTLFANIINAIQSVVEPIRINGGFYEGFATDGRRIDYGYTIKCDASLNPVAQLEEGTIKARLGVRVSSIGDKIQVDLIKSNLTTALA
jgi:uncharacterized protein